MTGPNASIPTFEALAAEVIADAKERSTNDKVRYQWDLLLGPRYCDPLLQKPINQITTLDIEQVLRPVWRSKPETGRKLLVRLRRVFDYARVHLRDRHGIVMPSNPAAWQDLRDRGFERISKLTRGRQAALDYQQTPEFFAAIRQRQGFAARALEVTLLTGLRTGEVIGARWTEIDLERKTWVIPAERLKDRKTRTEPHRVPLSPQVVAILKALPRLGEFVFPGLKPSKPLSNIAMRSILKDMNCDESGEPRWMIRRAAARSRHMDCGPHLGHGEKMRVFRATSSKIAGPSDRDGGRAGLSAHRRLRSATCNHAGLGRFLLWQAYWPPGRPLQGSNANHDD